MVESIRIVITALEHILYLLHKQRTEDGSRKFREIISKSLCCLKDKLDAIKKIKIRVVVFGPLGQGKSFVLNQLFRHGMSDDFTLLPSGEGDSKTPIPVKIKYAQDVELTLRYKDKEGVPDMFETCLTCLGDIDVAHSLTVETVADILANKDFYEHAKFLDVLSPLPVFDHLKSLLAQKCTYEGIDVQIEFVDLPGRGDNNGDHLIGNELDLADIIMIFKSSSSGRSITQDDISAVFQRRRVFDYSSRPMFVYLSNEKDSSSSSLDSPSLDVNTLQSKRNEEFQLSWENLMKCKDDKEECYKAVYERLPQTSTENVLEVFKKESKTVIFKPSDKDFADSVGDIISQHVNNVSIKKNAHPVVQTVFTLTNRLQALTKRLIANQMETTDTHESRIPQGAFRPSENLPFEISIPLEGDLLHCLPKLNDLLRVSTMDEVHAKLIGAFSEDAMAQHLLKVLENALHRHWKKMISASLERNKLFFNETSQSFLFLAEIACSGLVAKFLDDGAKKFVLGNISRLVGKPPQRGMRAQWETVCEEEKELMLLDHCHYLTGELSKSFEHGHRREALQPMLENLHGTVETFFKAGVQLCDQRMNGRVLTKIRDKLEQIGDFTLNKLREVNPHADLKDRCLTASMPFPELKSIKGLNKTPTFDPNKIFRNLFTMMKKGDERSLCELRRKLNLPVGSLDVPCEELDEFEWIKILLCVLYDRTFHHIDFGDNQILDDSLRVEPDTVPKHYLDAAKQQLFAYQKSIAGCEMIEDASIPKDTIQTRINDRRDGIVAFIGTDLQTELMKLSSLDDQTKDLAPIFILPTRKGGPGNVYLEQETNASKDQIDESTSQNDEAATQTQSNGLEGHPTNIFYVVEPGQLDNSKSLIVSKPLPPNNKIILRYVVLPQDDRCGGFARSIVKLLAECLSLPIYWVIEDDVQTLTEFERNSFEWVESSFARCLLHGQRVFKDCLNKAVNDLDEGKRYQEYREDLRSTFPEWATEGKIIISFLLLLLYITLVNTLRYDARSHWMTTVCIFQRTDASFTARAQENSKNHFIYKTRSCCSMRWFIASHIPHESFN